MAALLVIVSTTFRDYAISNDEEVQQRYGELIVAYYTSGFADQALFHFQNLYLYGGLFDILSTLLAKILPADVYVIRHVLCALIGLCGIAATWATARLIAGPRAALMATVTLAVCGAWYGGMFNHTKDIPFSAAMMGATYFLCRAARNFPKPHWRHVLGFGVLLGLALGVRVLGLLFVGYAAFAILLAMPKAPVRVQAGFVTRSFFMLVPAFILAYLMMIAVWPWAALEPFNPIRGLIAFGEFHYKIATILAGKIYEMWDVPRFYVPVYLLIKLPLAMLLGALILPVLTFAPARPSKDRYHWLRRDITLLGLIALFPLLEIGVVKDRRDISRPGLARR